MNNPILYCIIPVLIGMIVSIPLVVSIHNDIMAIKGAKILAKRFKTNPEEYEKFAQDHKEMVEVIKLMNI